MNPYQIYVARGNWKCLESPGGAHHWIIDCRGLGERKYCFALRKYPNTPEFVGDRPRTSETAASLRTGGTAGPDAAHVPNLAPNK